jgi:hypothetical protein
MRTRHVVTFTALTAGVTAAAALHRRAARRLPVPATTPAPLVHPVEPVAEHDGVVLPFVRPVAAAPAPAPAQPSTPARCGENGGLTKAGAPCAARATAGGRCHHHRLAA